jgi:molybdopterin synthase catalytic subunit
MSAERGDVPTSVPHASVPGHLSADPIDARALSRAVEAPSCGAVLVFEGVARATGQRDAARAVIALEYEAWAGPATRALSEIEEEAATRFGARVRIVHRTGRVAIGETAVVVAVAAPHRDAAYAASRHAIDTLKARVPIWKKECYADGSSWMDNRP